jgi:hypothetical protein
MIFSHTLDLVMSGRKSQTRRLRKPHEELRLDSTSGQIQAVLDRRQRVKWKVGQTYAVQPKRGAKQVGRLYLKAIHTQTLADIDEKDAQAEGFIGRTAFYETWRALHGTVNLQDKVWVLEFEWLGHDSGNR